MHTQQPLDIVPVIPLQGTAHIRLLLPAFLLRVFLLKTYLIQSMDMSGAVLLLIEAPSLREQALAQVVQEQS